MDSPIEKRKRGQRKIPPILERFNAKWVLDPVNGCWLWTAHIRPTDGYTGFRSENGIQTGHKWSWEHVNGPVPKGMQLDHLCRVRHCVNPEHLEVVTPRINMLRGNTFQAKHAATTHCPQGHPYDEQNTYVYSDGRRSCRECRRRYVQEFRALNGREPKHGKRGTATWKRKSA